MLLLKDKLFNLSDQIRSGSTLIKVDKPQPYKHKTMIEVNVDNKTRNSKIINRCPRKAFWL